MKVLSIDLDYIMGPVIELYNELRFDDNPVKRWEDFFSETDFNESHFRIDQSKIACCACVNNTWVKLSEQNFSSGLLYTFRIFCADRNNTSLEINQRLGGAITVVRHD